jgi:hypothetical protein
MEKSLLLPDEVADEVPLLSLPADLLAESLLAACEKNCR